MKRRQFVERGIGIVAIASLAGCSGSEDENVVTGGNGGNNEDTKKAKQAEKTQQSKKTKESEKKIKILNHELYQEEYSAGVRGKLKNVSGKELGYVEVSVRFFNTDGTRIAEGLDNFSELGSGVTTKFDAMFLGDNPDAIDHYELEVSAGFM